LLRGLDPNVNVEAWLNRCARARVLEVYEGRWRFAHDKLREAVISSLVPEEQRKLHRQVAEAIEERYRADLSTLYSRLAYHWSRAVAGGQADPALVSKAIDYLQQAGEQAVRSSADVEAISHLTLALELLETLPDTPDRARQAFQLHLALSGPLITTRGYGAPETVQAFDRARQLAAQTGDTSQLFPLLYGKWVAHLVRAEYQASLKVGEQFLSLAKQQPDFDMLMIGYRLVGVSLNYKGQFQSARINLEHALALYNPPEHEALAFRFGQNPGAAAQAWLSSVLWSLGYPDQALHMANEAVAYSRRLNHANTSGLVLLFGAVHSQRAGDVAGVEERAKALTALAEKYELALWSASAIIFEGWTLVKRDDPALGVSQILKGLAHYQATGTRTALTHYWTLLVEGYVALGQVQEGLAVIREALAFVNETNERHWAAELLRLRGELLLNDERGMMNDEANQKLDPEDCFLKAIGLARQQQAKSLELRAVLSLARLWQAQGRTAEARQMLAEIYGWFTEGFDTAHLLEAKALLEELS
jgi:predicted ATPase